MHSILTGQKNTSYRLSMQTLSDELDANHVEHQLLNSGSAAQLSGIRLYQPGCKLMPEYVYLIPYQTEHPDLRWSENICFIVFGRINSDEYAFTSSVIGISSSHTSQKIFSLIQDIFEKYNNWDLQLHWALHSDTPLDRMLQVSLPIFDNPLFLHDKDFYILSCPRWVTGMLQWEKEPRTKREMIPLDLINTFRVDDEYLNSLKTKSPAIFSATIRGYRVLFNNLWHQDHYSGRICIDELERPLRKSDREHLHYLAEMISMCINKQNMLWLSIGNEIDTFFADILSGVSPDSKIAGDYLQYLNWNADDHYVILKIVSDREDYRAVTPSTLLGYIEAQISECRAMMFQQDIVVIVNLTASAKNISEVLSSLAYILRDGMLKVGVSSEMSAFSNLRHGYIQATVALDYGKRSYSMIWYYHFRDYALQFLLDSACNTLPPHLLCSEKLQKLKQYDLENNTDLYHTAEVYLKYERNAVLTAKDLFIHRSTLFYRLNRIQQISGIDFDNEDERLYLMISFHMPQNEI